MTGYLNKRKTVKIEISSNFDSVDLDKFALRFAKVASQVCCGDETSFQIVLKSSRRNYNKHYKVKASLDKH